jgi:hypothetical protein
MENKWITPQLKAEVRKVFEPRYKRPLTDSEIISIAENLTQLLEVFFKFKRRTYGVGNTKS